MDHNRYIKIDGYPNLIKDLQTNAIINVDTQSLENYLLNKNKRFLEKSQIKSLSNDIENLKSSMDEIKQLLKGLVNGS